MILTVIPSPTPRQCLGGATCGYKNCRKDGADDTGDNEMARLRDWIDEILRHSRRWRQKAFRSKALAGNHVECTSKVEDGRNKAPACCAPARLEAEGADMFRDHV